VALKLIRLKGKQLLALSKRIKSTLTWLKEEKEEEEEEEEVEVDFDTKN